MVEQETKGYRLNWKVNKVIIQKKTEFQNLAVVELEDFGRALVLDEAIQVTEGDEYIYNEMIAHIPLVTHPNPQDVLIIGGGDGGALREVLKYKEVKTVDLVEIDRDVIEASKKYLPSIGCSFDNKRANIIFDDGIKYLKNTTKKYDVIIIDSSDPVGPAVELFQKEFYQNCYNALRDDGILTAQTESPFFYKKVLNKSFNYIKDIFNYASLYLACVPTYPSGLWSFTLGSKKYRIEDTEPYKKEIEGSTRYYIPEIYHSVFKLPLFVKEIIEEDYIKE